MFLSARSRTHSGHSSTTDFALFLAAIDGPIVPVSGVKYTSHRADRTIQNRSIQTEIPEFGKLLVLLVLLVVLVLLVLLVLAINSLCVFVQRCCWMRSTEQISPTHEVLETYRHWQLPKQSNFDTSNSDCDIDLPLEHLITLDYILKPRIYWPREIRPISPVLRMHN